MADTLHPPPSWSRPRIFSAIRLLGRSAQRFGDCFTCCAGAGLHYFLFTSEPGAIRDAFRWRPVHPAKRARLIGNSMPSWANVQDCFWTREARR